MRRGHVVPLLAVGIVFLLSWLCVTPCGAFTAGGGGDTASRDCFIGLGGVTGNYSGGLNLPVVCNDCDPACDKDGVSQPNGSCTFNVAVCVNQPLSFCRPAPLTRTKVRARFRGRVLSNRIAGVLPLPSDLSGSPACGEPTAITVPTASGPSGHRPFGQTDVKLRAMAVSPAIAVSPGGLDHDTIALICRPSTACPTAPLCGTETSCAGEGTCVEGTCLCPAVADCADGLRWDSTPSVCDCL